MVSPPLLACHEEINCIGILRNLRKEVVGPDPVVHELFSNLSV
jgi:hypothetical protein